MNFSLEEQVKHRIVGGLVILSLFAVLFPALVKKSNYRLDKKVRISMQVPAKPALPKLAIPAEAALFAKTAVQETQVALETETQLPAVPELAKADTNLQSVQSMKPQVELAQAKTAPALPIQAKAIKETQAKLHLATKKAPNPKPPKTTALNSKDYYAVQLASFANPNNARELVSKLKGQGFDASFSKVRNTKGDFFKVIVGKLDERNQAQNLQEKLALNTKMSGMIVKTGVS